MINTYSITYYITASSIIPQVSAQLSCSVQPLPPAQCCISRHYTPIPEDIHGLKHWCQSRSSGSDYSGPGSPCCLGLVGWRQLALHRQGLCNDMWLVSNLKEWSLAYIHQLQFWIFLVLLYVRFSINHGCQPVKSIEHGMFVSSTGFIDIVIWASWRLKSTVTRLFVQQFAQANAVENSELNCWLLWAGTDR